MASEVFPDRGAADALNSGFVCVKVDRQERPDLDRYLMEFMTESHEQDAAAGGRGSVVGDR
jgi:uncharacterized protein YyaL (SSP411 family)